MRASGDEGMRGCGHDGVRTCGGAGNRGWGNEGCGEESKTKCTLDNGTPPHLHWAHLGTKTVPQVCILGTTVHQHKHTGTPAHCAHTWQISGHNDTTADGRVIEHSGPLCNYSKLQVYMTSTVLRPAFKTIQ